LWLYEHLRDELPAIDWEQHRIDLLGARMSAAISSLERAADHLGLEDQKSRLRLTIQQFDSAPEEIRDGWRARQVAKVLRGSWSLAKGIAFAGERLPVKAELSWKRAQGLTRKRRESEFALSGIEDWLETKPAKKTRNAYDVWVKSRNAELDQDQRPIQAGKSLYTRFSVPWSEIVKAVEEKRVPGEVKALATGLATPESEAADSPAQLRAVRSDPAQPLKLDPIYRAKLLQAARKERGWTVPEAARRAGLSASQLAKIEQGRIRNSSFESWAKLAHLFDLSLDALAAGPPADD
jgi:DNA-binding XRE family transcriptional regulator